MTVVQQVIYDHVLIELEAWALFQPYYKIEASHVERDGLGYGFGWINVVYQGLGYVATCSTLFLNVGGITVTSGQQEDAERFLRFEYHDVPVDKLVGLVLEGLPGKWRHE